VINGFGPAQTSGNTISKAHTLSNLKAPGDSATYRVDIQTAACYKIYIRQRNTDSVGLQMDLALQNKVTSFMFNGESTQYIGKQHLSKSKSELSLQVVENKSIKPWTQLSGLRRILFIPCDNDVSIQQLSLPN